MIPSAHSVDSLSPQEPFDACQGEREDTVHCAIGVPAQMGSHDYIQVAKVMVPLALILKDVQPCPSKVPGAEGRDKRLRVDDGTARRIDEDGACLHLGQTASIYEVMGGIVQRDVEGDGMTLCQQILQRHVLKAQLLGGRGILEQVVSVE